MIADDHGGTMESGFLALIGFSWTSADTFRRSLGMVSGFVYNDQTFKP